MITYSESIDYKALGKRVRNRRKTAGMTQEALAEAVNCAVTYISSIENGHAKVSLGMLVKLSQALETTCDSLLYDSTPVLYDNYDKDMQEILKTCTESERRFLLDIARDTRDRLVAFANEQK